MLTDIILLDLFNSFGLPTSTTVSIVFELLGAAVAMSVIKVIKTGDGLSGIMKYINSGKALTIIFGILLSVVVAFITGAVIQFFPNHQCFFYVCYNRLVLVFNKLISKILDFGVVIHTNPPDTQFSIKIIFARLCKVGNKAGLVGAQPHMKNTVGVVPVEQLGTYDAGVGTQALGRVLLEGVANTDRRQVLRLRKRAAW